MAGFFVGRLRPDKGTQVSEFSLKQIRKPQTDSHFLCLDVFCCGKIVGHKPFKISDTKFPNPKPHMFISCGWIFAVAITWQKRMKKQQKNRSSNSTSDLNATVATGNPLNCKMGPLGGQCHSVRASCSQYAKSKTRTSIPPRHKCVPTAAAAPNSHLNISSKPQS